MNPFLYLLMRASVLIMETAEAASDIKDKALCVVKGHHYHPRDTPDGFIWFCSRCRHQRKDPGDV